MGWVGCGGGAEVGKDLGVGTRTGKDGLCYERQEGKTWTVISHSWPSWQFKPVHSLVGGLFSAFQYALKIHCWMLSSIPGHCSLDTRETHSPNSDNQNVSTMPNIGGIKFTPRWGSFSSVLFSLVAQLCTTLCDPRDYSTPGLPVHHQLPELTQTHVHWVSDAIQPSYPLSSPSPSAFNLSQHQGLFKWVNSSHQVAKVSEFQLQDQSFQWIPRTDLL